MISISGTFRPAPYIHQIFTFKSVIHSTISLGTVVTLSFRSQQFSIGQHMFSENVDWCSKCLRENLIPRGKIDNNGVSPASVVELPLMSMSSRHAICFSERVIGSKPSSVRVSPVRHSHNLASDVFPVKLLKIDSIPTSPILLLSLSPRIKTTIVKTE